VRQHDGVQLTAVKGLSKHQHKAAAAYKYAALTLGGIMPIRIFYSWQSDQPQNRGFIRSALDSAIAELRQDLTLDEPQRDIIADQDTQGVSGSPAIADTILSKIRSTDIFLADLTFISSDSNRERQSPNPNVMLEYGYALHALGESKVIGVFNEAHGSPKELPFDLLHRRWPIRFSLAANHAPDREKQKKVLKEALKIAIRGIVSQFDEQPTASADEPSFEPTIPGDGIGLLRHAQDYLCLRSNQERPVWLKPGPYSFLRFIPTKKMEELGEVEAYRIAQAYLQPMGGMRSGGWDTGRHTTGTVVYWTSKDSPTQAYDASELFLTRELWANDFYHIISSDRDRAKEVEFQYIPTGAFEEVLIDAFINFVGVARDHLKLTLPVDIFAGVANVQGVRLAVDQNYFSNAFEGTILRDNYTWRSELVDWNVDPFDFLRPYFEKIYDIAGTTRPPTRTTGRRQR
jgi:hypothetical protein